MSLARKVFDHEQKHISCTPAVNHAQYMVENYLADTGEEDKVSYMDFREAVVELREKYLDWCEEVGE